MGATQQCGFQGQGLVLARMSPNYVQQDSKCKVCTIEAVGSGKWTKESHLPPKDPPRRPDDCRLEKVIMRITRTKATVHARFHDEQSYERKVLCWLKKAYPN